MTRRSRQLAGLAATRMVDHGRLRHRESLAGGGDRPRELGLKLIVTDHHQMADRLPDAAAIVHPRLPTVD